MKYIIAFLITLTSGTLFAQHGSSSWSVLRQKLTATSGDTTDAAFNTSVTNAVSTGYAVQFWNNVATTPHYDFINSEGTQHVFNFSSGGNFWKNAGTTTLTGNATINLSGNDLSFNGGASTARVILSAENNIPRIFSFRTNNVHRWAFRVDGDETGSDAGGDFAIRRYNDAGTFVDAPISITRSTGLTTIGGPLKVTSGTPGAGKVLTSDADGDATWETPSGGGATAAGATGNVQYKSAGGGLQAEAGFTYDSATNILTVPFAATGLITTPSALTDAASIDLTAVRHTLTSSSAARTFTISYTGDYTSIYLTLNTTAAVYTFPASSLCVVGGVPSADNTATLSGVSGDVYKIVIENEGGGVYSVFVKNMIR